MTGAHVLVELVIVLGSAAVITLLFHFLRLPVVLGYVAAGLVIGPHVPFPLVANPGLVAVLSELGVILLMFAIGLELRLSTLAKVGLGAGLAALFEVALALTLAALAARALGFSGTESLFAGGCFAISSTMLVAKAFEEKGWKGGFTELVFALLVFEDLIAIALLAVLTGVASGAGLGPTALAWTLGKLGLFLVVTLVVGLLVVPRLVRAIAGLGRRETLLITALAVCFGLAIVTEHFGYPVALGAFLAGLLVSESGLGHEIGELVRPFRDVFAMMFFVSIGMTIVPAQLANNLPAILVFSVIVLIAKPLGVSLGLFGAGRGLIPSLRSGVTLAQTGELAFVIAGIGIAAKVARPDLLAIAVGVTCLTTLTSSLMIGRSEPIAHVIAARLPSRIATFLGFYSSWLGRLRGRERVVWPKVRRNVFMLLADVVATIAVVIIGSLLGHRGARELGFSGVSERVVVLVLGIVAVAPFAIGIVRRVASISRTLAAAIIPPPVEAPGQVDLGRAPRRALTLSLELGLSAAIAVPLIAIVQPVIGTTGLIALTVPLVIVTLAYRSIVDFTQHVRAGSELILELLHQPAAPEDKPMEQIESVLPGFGGLVTITVDAASPAIGKSLAQLDLRARTGASVLAISRGAGGFATPAPTEPLQANDVLAVAGPDESIAAARLLLSQP